MAYVSQELKAKLAPAIKAALKKHNLKGSLSVDNHSTLVLNITEGSIDFIKNFNDIGSSRSSHAAEYIEVNPYWYHDHFSGVAKNALREILILMNDGNWDKSDLQTDYFNVGWYVKVKIGRWNKPYKLV